MDRRQFVLSTLSAIVALQQAINLKQLNKIQEQDQDNTSLVSAQDRIEKQQSTLSDEQDNLRKEQEKTRNRQSEIASIFAPVLAIQSVLTRLSCEYMAQTDGVPLVIAHNVFTIATQLVQQGYDPMDENFWSVVIERYLEGDDADIDAAQKLRNFHRI